MNLNKVLLIGRVTKDLELKQTNGGISVTSFSLAINRTWTKDGVKKEEVEFANIVIFGKTAELVCKYVVRGQVLFVEGRLQTREWETKDGQKRKTIEVIGENVQFGSKPNGNTLARGDEPVKSDTIPVINIDDEIKTEDLGF